MTRDVALAPGCASSATALLPARRRRSRRQPAAGTRRTVLKGKAPVSKEILKVTLPKPQEADLVERRAPDGARGSPRAAVVNFQMIIDGAGGYYDPAGMPGLAGFTASLMREGTDDARRRSRSREQLDRLAATVSVGAGISSPFATVSGSALTNNRRHRARD